MEANQMHLVNHCPFPQLLEPSSAFSAINAIVDVTQNDWLDVYIDLIDSVHRLKLMPDDHRCLELVLNRYGFKRIERVKGYRSVKDFCQQLTPNHIYILQAHTYYHDYYVVAREREDHYHCFCEAGVMAAGVKTVWQWCDEEIIPRHMRITCKPKEQEDHLYFHYCNMNPQNYRIDDCVIRALATLTNKTWDDVIDELAGFADYCWSVINSAGIYHLFLEHYGFKQHCLPRIDGRLPKGDAFCQYLDEHYHHGEKFFVEVYSNHVVAVVNREGHYVFMDHWDSTKCTVFEYWSLDGRSL